MTQALTLPGTDITPTPRKQKAGGRPPKPRQTKRSKVARVCLTEGEYAALEAMATQARMPVSVLIAQRLFTDQVPAIHHAA